MLQGLGRQLALDLELSRLRRHQLKINVKVDSILCHRNAMMRALFVAFLMIGHVRGLNIDWMAGFSDPSARSKNAAPGSTLTFTWTSTHNVYKMASATVHANGLP